MRGLDLIKAEHGDIETHREPARYNPEHEVITGRRLSDVPIYRRIGARSLEGHAPGRVHQRHWS